MAYFAINVIGGQELKMIELIQKYVKHHNAYKFIQSIITPTLKVRRIKSNGEKSFTVRTAGLSYLYIKTPTNCVNIPAELYQFLKKIPGVLNVIRYSINDDEVEQFCQAVGTNLEDSEVYLTFEHNETKVQRIKRKCIEIINGNKKRNLLKKKQLLKKIQKIDSSPINQLIQILKEMEVKDNKYKVSIRKNTVIVKIPFLHILQLKDDLKHIDSKIRYKPETILPFLIKTLKN